MYCTGSGGVLGISSVKLLKKGVELGEKVILGSNWLHCSFVFRVGDNMLDEVLEVLYGVRRARSVVGRNEMCTLQ